MDSIPTAKEYVSNKCLEKKSDKEDIPDWIIEEFKEFAKLHVKAALEIAAECAIAKEDPRDFGTGDIWVDQKSILDSYPLSNIK